MNFEEALAVADEAIFVKAGRHLSNVEIAILKGSWEHLTYEQIASDAKYSIAYVKRHVGPQLWKLLSEAFDEQVSKSNFRFALERQWRNSVKLGTPDNAIQNHANYKNFSFQNNAVALQSGWKNLLNNGNFGTATLHEVQNRADWGEAIDVSVFYGRTAELKTLEHWILQERCRLVALLGMGGMGKTSLAAKLAQQIQGQFDYFIWRSLHNAPPLVTLLDDLIKFLSSGQVLEPNLPNSVESRLSQLVDYLRRHRCLIVLDNMESILQSGTIAGNYREGYEQYAQLLKFIGEIPHNSCFLITSREKLKELSILEGKSLPIRCLPISGLDVADGQKILEAKGLRGSGLEITQLVNLYSGNALSLKIIATTIIEIFDGSIAEFFSQNTSIFGNIREIYLN
jgi:effector-binding domain-containing protein